MLMLLFRVVPLLSIDEIEEIDEMEEMDNAAAAAAYLRTQPSEPVAKHVSLVGAGGTAPRVAGVAGVLLLVAFLGMFSVGRAAPVAAATTPGATKIALSGSQAAGAGAPVQLTAKLTGPAGQPLAKADVKFLLATTVFGPRPVPLGSAKTDATGIARLTLGGHSAGYRPTTTGPQEFVASYAPTGEEAIESSTNINVTGARSAYTPAPPKPLDAAGTILVKALFLIVATVWLLLIAQVVRVRRVCRPLRTPRVSSA
jgi:hypothetical protein